MRDFLGLETVYKMRCSTLWIDHVLHRLTLLLLSCFPVPLPSPFLLLYLICRIVLSTPLAVISYFLIWYVPPFENGKVIWYLFFYCLFQSLQTVSTTCARTNMFTITFHCRVLRVWPAAQLWSLVMSEGKNVPLCISFFRVYIILVCSTSWED